MSETDGDGGLPPPGSVTQIGRYQVQKELGRGAMGVVYLGVDPKIQRRVALKVLHAVAGVSEADLEEFRSRFYREARTAGMLAHPNIVVIHDVDSDDSLGITFMAMEFLNGQPLNDLLRSGVAFTRDQAVDICIQVAEGLDHAHRQGVVHRDIKPGNLMLLEDGTVKITDFGIAKISTSNLTRTGQFLGTPNYMSPEQVIGHVIDGRSDLFSLGIILYELLTGEKPFMGSSLTTITYQIVNVDPIEPSKIRPGIPKVFDAIVARLLRKAPDERFQTGKEVADTLRGLKEGAKVASATATLVGAGAAGATGAPRPVSPTDATQVAMHSPADTSLASRTAVAAGAPAAPRRGAPRALVLGGVAATLALAVVVALGLAGGGEEAPSAAEGSADPTGTGPATGSPAAGTTAQDGAKPGGQVAPATGTQTLAGPGAATAGAPAGTTAGASPATTAPGATGAKPAPIAGTAPPATLPPRRAAPAPAQGPPLPIALPPRRTAGGPLTATEPARVAGKTNVRFVAEHGLKSDGRVVVYLDDRQVAEVPLRVDNKKKGGLSEASFEVPDGSYTVKVCLESAELAAASFTKCPYKLHSFVMNTTATIRATHLDSKFGPPKFYFTVE